MPQSQYPFAYRLAGSIAAGDGAAATMPTNYALHLVQSALGDTFALNALTRYVAAWRRKPVTVCTHELPFAITGVCLPFRDLDVVWLNMRLDPVRRRAALLHEYAHLLLDHVVRCSDNDATPTYAQFLQQQHSTGVHARARMHTHTSMYADPYELAAETLGRHLAEHVAQPAARRLAAQEVERLRALHAQFMQIVPQVALTERVADAHIEIEIGDARDYVWSQEHITEPLTPQGEAAHLHTLLHAGQVLTTLGQYAPPPTRFPVHTHNLAVARQLMAVPRLVPY